MKKLCLFGATGSIGQNCLDIVERHSEKFSVSCVSAHANIAGLFEAAKRCEAPVAVISNREPDAEWRARFAQIGTRLEHGSEMLEALADEADYDLLVNAIVGAAGLRPTLAALKKSKTVALANKETLVTAGELVMRVARENDAALLPIDSEHSALWQCLVGEDIGRVETLTLTASGGPFRELPPAAFNEITVAQALDHPNWDMGKKITIDSATMMNKGLEVIEAFWLFGIPIEKIDVLVHPQSIIHSMVTFVDGSIKAQLGLPDMRVPIQYALSWPDRYENTLPRMDFASHKDLSFFEPDFERFPCLRLAFDAVAEGGTAPAVLNAANEEAVYAFLDERIGFMEIAALVSEALAANKNHSAVDIENIAQADNWARKFVKERV